MYSTVSPSEASTWQNGIWYCRSLALVNQFSTTLSITPFLVFSGPDLVHRFHEDFVLLPFLPQTMHCRRHSGVSDVDTFHLTSDRVEIHLSDFLGLEEKLLRHRLTTSIYRGASAFRRFIQHL